MHIPDGYISPASAAALYGAAAPFWWVASRRLKERLTGRLVPLLALFAAFSFTIMLFNIPVPGGTTAHAVGGTLAAIVMGPWAAIIAVSVALVIQALFFGDGGITAIGANSFNLAVALPLVGYGVYRLLSGRSDRLSRRRVVAAAVGAYVGINVAGLLVGVELGIQPLLWSEGGRALYAPYPLEVAVPALLVPHLTVAGAAEAIATAFGLAYIQRAHPYLLEPDVSASAPEPVRRRAFHRPVIALIVVAVVAVPIGLLASGSAWGEWSADEVAAQVGYVPAGLERISAFWSAPFPDYAPSLAPTGASFAEQAAAYVLSAVVGIGLLFVVAFGARILLRRRADRRSPAAGGGG